MKHAYGSLPAEQGPRGEKGSEPVFAFARGAAGSAEQMVREIMSNVFAHIRTGVGTPYTMWDRILHFSLMAAVSEGDNDSVLLLIEQGADIGAGLIRALEFQQYDVATSLVKHGASVIDAFGACRPLYVAAKHGSVKMLDFLLENGAGIDSADDESSFLQQEGTALFAAAANGHAPAVEFLLEHGAHPGIRSSLHESPLDKAAENGNEAMVRALLLHGAPVNDVSTQQESDRRSCLHNASTGRVVDLLVEAGADVEARANRGITPLLAALSVPFAPEALRALVRHGADVNVQDDNGNSVLHFVARLLSSHVKPDCRKLAVGLVDFLLRSGADETLTNNAGKTAADKAREFGSCPEGEDVCVLKLLDNAHADRAWRRRGLLVLCIARHHSGRLLSAESLITPATDGTVKERADGWTHAAGWLLGLSLEKAGVFQTIVGYL